MKIFVLSDLHLEMISIGAKSDLFIPDDADMTVIAGGFYRADVAVRRARTEFPTGALVMVGGNDEHYLTGMTVSKGIDKMRADAREDSGVYNRPTYFLENDTVYLGNDSESVRVIGCTLWTDFKLFGNYDLHASHAQMNMNDYRFIKGLNECKLMAFETADWHAQSRSYIERELLTPFSGKTIVVTHHLPSARSVRPRFRTDPFSPAFASNCDHLLELGADLWIHGHIHDSCDYMVGEKTRVVCNPRGYKTYHRPEFWKENRAFIKDLIIEI